MSIVITIFLWLVIHLKIILAVLSQKFLQKVIWTGLLLQPHRATLEWRCLFLLLLRQVISYTQRVEEFLMTPCALMMVWLRSASSIKVVI